jgi:phosphoglycolate phosphatase
MMPRFDAVVFDLDGTLVDSRVAIIDAVQAGIRQAVAEADLEPPDIDPASLRAALGKPADEYFRAVLPETLGHLAPAVKEAATRREVEALAAGHGRLFEGVLDSLDALRSAGIRLAAVSNAQAPYFRAAIDHTGLAERFDHSECHDELPAGSEPPYKLVLLRRALQELGVDAARSLMVGDRAEDLEAGLAAGCTTMAIPFGFGDEAELAIADLRLSHYSKLPSLVGV